MEPPTRRTWWSRFAAIGLPFFKQVRGKAWGGLAALVALLLAINGMIVANSYVGKDFMTALSEKDAHRFFYYALLLAGVFAVSTVIEVFARYAEQRLGLVWRRWLTDRFLDRYLARRTYLWLADRHDIDNPDERISLDVKTFTTTTLSILVLSANGVMTVVAFSGVLWLITPWLFFAALGYAVAGSVGTLWLGRRLITLNNLQLQREADFRYGLGRVREHAEAVAQAAGEADQRRRLERWLAALVANFRTVIRVSRNLGFFTVAYKYFPQIIPAAIVAPLYFRGETEFGTVTQAAMAFSQVQGAFSLFVTQFQEVTTYAASVDRLSGLWEATEPAAAPERAGPLPRAGAKAAAPPPEPSAGPVVQTSPAARRVVYERVTLWAPDRDEGRPLVRDLNLEVPEGRRLVVTGPAAAGRAVLLATAGLWHDGRGRIHRPGPGDVMFVPRQPPAASGRLRDILLNGLDPNDPGREAAEGRLRAALDAVGLGDAVNRAGGLDADQNWAAVLSADDRLALTFARLLLAGPRFAFLEALAESVESAAGEHLYRALADSPITYVSIGCPPALLRYHDRLLELRDDGSWQMSDGQRVGT
jgi:putative ATP-binding cassette transporter